jgi:hypothetical protein
MRRPQVLKWYVRELRQLARPRDDARLERAGVQRLILGARAPGNGWGAVLWSWLALVVAVVALAAPFAGQWRFGLALLPLVAHAVARSIGTFREGHLF